MQLTTKRFGRLVIVAVSGRVDHLSANTLRAEIDPVLSACSAAGDALIVDLAGLEYISSAGLRVFMLMSREVKARKGRVALAAMQPVVREIFDISKFTLLFEIFPDVMAAAEALAPGVLHKSDV